MGRASLGPDGKPIHKDDLYGLDDLFVPGNTFTVTWTVYNDDQTQDVISSETITVEETGPHSPRELNRYFHAQSRKGYAANITNIDPPPVMIGIPTE